MTQLLRVIEEQWDIGISAILVQLGAYSHKNLAQMAPTPEILQHLLRLLKLEHSVNNWLSFVPLIKSQHLLKPISQSIQHAYQSQILPDSLKIDIHPLFSRINFA